MRKISALIMTVILLAGFDPPVTNPAKPTEEVTIILELDGSPQAFKDHVETRLPRLEVVEEYDTIFNGVAIRGTAQELEKISRLDTIVNQYPVHTYQALNSERLAFSTDTIRQELDLPYTGEGVKVGVIDTGIDYNHPDLQANYKGGFDLVDFDKDPMETLKGGATIHGTHVAGVIAANGEMKGIAPRADLYAYRALGPGGAGSSVQVIAAIEEAVEDGMDVINLSLGNQVNGPDWPTTKAVNKAIELGTVVVAAAGNSGPDTWTVGSPGTSSSVITVGASALPSDIPILQFPGGRRKIAVHTLMGSAPWTLTKKYPLHFAGIGEGEIGDVAGKIAVFERGEIPFSEKAQKAYQAGAVAVIIYNNEKGAFQGSLNGVDLPIPVAAVSKKDGQWLKKQGMKENQWVESSQKSVGQMIAPFSSRGPVTTSWEVKPDIVAPGVNILSTVPGGYQPLQGTSMASPHVAGIAALIKEAHPNWTPAQVKASLMSTADLIKGEEGLYQPTEQGTGMIDPEEAINPNLWIKPGALQFGRIASDFSREERTLTLTNRTEETQTLRFDRPELKQGISWSTPGTITIPANETKEVKIELRLSKAFVEAGVHQGYLTLKSKEKDYKIPYLFMNGNADYAKVSGFELYQDWETTKDLSYRFHLSEDVDRVTVELFRAGTMLRKGQLFELEEPKEGLNEGEIEVRDQLGGFYIAVVTVEKADTKESYPFSLFLETET